MELKILVSALFVEALAIFSIFYSQSFKKLELIDYTAPCVFFVLSTTSVLGYFFYVPKSEEASMHISNIAVFFYWQIGLFCHSEYQADVLMRILFFLATRVPTYDFVLMHVYSLFFIVSAEIPLHF